MSDRDWLLHPGARRIILDAETLSEKLSELSFTEQSGLWVPPQDLASGGVVIGPRIVQPVNACVNGSVDDLRLHCRLSLDRGDMMHFSFTVRGSYAWYAIPGGSILFNDGRRLDGFNIVADIKNP